jgi:small GTP-binding protein
MRTIKVVFVGETRVGKSSILRRFVDGTFDEAEMSTIGTAFSTKVIPTSSGTILLQLWDTAGQEQYRSLASMYYRNAHVALLVYDFARRETFTSLSAWMDEVSVNAPSEIRPIVVGNKTDLGTRAVTRDEARAFAEAIHAIAYIETSAKTGEGVKELFQAVGLLDAGVEESRPVIDQGGGWRCCRA